MSKTSPIWAYFEDEVEKGRCRICQETVPKTGSNTSGMWSHLEHRHPTHYAKHEQFKKEKTMDTGLFCEFVKQSIEKDKELAEKDKELASLRKELEKTKAQLDLYKKHDASVPSGAEFEWCIAENPVVYSDVVRMDERKIEQIPNPDSESNQIDNFDESEFFAQIDTLSNQENVSEQPSTSATSAGAGSKEAEPKTDANE